MHATLEKVGDDYGRRQTFNTAIAAVMELMNALSRCGDQSPAGRGVMQEALENIVLMLSPIVPHVCQVLWRELRDGADILQEAWPESDRAALVQDEIELVIQVNGKLRGAVKVAKEADRESIEAAARAHVEKFIGDQVVRKIIVVPGRLVNIVV